MIPIASIGVSVLSLLGAHGGSPFGWGWYGSAPRRARPCQSAAEISCREAGQYQPCREAGEEASPDPGDSRDRSTADPIDHGQPRMCWLRAAFAVALDCIATRTGKSAPGQTGGTARTPCSP